MVWHLPVWAALTAATRLAMRHPQLTSKLAYLLRKAYRDLSEEQKRVVNSIALEFGRRVCHATVAQLAPAAATAAINRGMNHKVARLTEACVRRAADVGIDKAIDEMKG